MTTSKDARVDVQFSQVEGQARIQSARRVVDRDPPRRLDLIIECATDRTGVLNGEAEIGHSSSAIDNIADRRGIDREAGGGDGVPRTAFGAISTAHIKVRGRVRISRENDVGGTQDNGASRAAAASAARTAVASSSTLTPVSPTAA